MDVNQNSSIYNVLAAAAKLPKADQLNFLISFLNKYGIYVHYEKNTGGPDQPPFSRLIITAKRGQADYRNRLTWECGGLVVGSDLLPISVPPKSHDIKYNPKTIARNLRDYRVIPSFDGTVVTLYYWGGSWRMSSMNGFDITSYKRNDDITFGDAFDDCLKEYPEFSYDKSLNKTCSYSFGFSHPLLHPTGFINTKAGKVWLISVNKLPQKDGDVKSWHPEEIIVDSIGGIRRQVPLHIKNVEELNDFSNAPYGFILRSKHHKDIIIESPLMANIRKLLYHDPIENKKFLGDLRAASPDDFGKNRMTFMIIKAFLDIRKRRQFRSLFSHREDIMKTMKDFEVFVGHVTQYVIAVFPLVLTGTPNVTQMAKDLVTPESARIMGKKFIDHIKKKEKINAETDDGKKILADLVLDPKYAEDYYTCFRM